MTTVYVLFFTHLDGSKDWVGTYSRLDDAQKDMDNLVRQNPNEAFYYIEKYTSELGE